MRLVKNSTGQETSRYSIVTPIILGEWRWPVEVTLVDRSAMKYDMILGRRAIRERNLVVDPGCSYLCGSPNPARLAIKE